jgi:glycosyltransferase involved in cell wall biosynthesis
LRTDLQVITRGVDITKIQMINRFDFSKSEVIFLHVGYLHPVKDPIMLINCFHLISKSIKCRLIQVGPDYMNGEVQQYANALGIGHLVDFCDFIVHEKIYQIFQEVNVLLHTSLYESQALVVNEALAHGLLVCGTKVGLLSDLDGQCCVTASTGDFKGLAKKVLQILNDRALTARLIENGLNWSKKYDLQWTTDRYAEIYLDLLNK